VPPVQVIDPTSRISPPVSEPAEAKERLLILLPLVVVVIVRAPPETTFKPPAFSTCKAVAAALTVTVVPAGMQTTSEAVGIDPVLQSVVGFPAVQSPDVGPFQLFEQFVAAVAVPLNVTICGLPGALSLIETVAERFPVVFGEKRTPIEHDCPGAIGGPITHGADSTTWKSPGFAPVREIPVIISGEVPWFVTVIVLYVVSNPRLTLAKGMFPGLTLATGPDAPTIRTRLFAVSAM
jgi:hypothetical protein